MIVPHVARQGKMRGPNTAEAAAASPVHEEVGPVSLLVGSLRELSSDLDSILLAPEKVIDQSLHRSGSLIDRLRASLRGSDKTFTEDVTTRQADPHSARRLALEDSMRQRCSELSRYDFRSHLPSWEISGFPGYASPRVHSPEQVFSMHSPEGIAKAIVALLNVAQKTEREIPAGKGAEETAHFLAQLRREIVGVKLEAVDMVGSEAPELITHETILALWDRASRSFVTHARGREALESLISASKAGTKLEGSAAAVHVEHVATALGYGGLGPSYLRSRSNDIAAHLMLLSRDPERGKAFASALIAAHEIGTATGEILSWRACAVEGMKGRFSDMQIAAGYSARGSNTKPIFASRAEAIEFLSRRAGKTPVDAIGTAEGVLQVAISQKEELRTNQHRIDHASEYSPGGSVVNRPLRGRERDDLEIFNNRHDYDLFEAARVVAGCANYEQHKGVVDQVLGSKPLRISDRDTAIAVLQYLTQGTGLPPVQLDELTPRGVGAVRDVVLCQIAAGQSALFASTQDGGAVELEAHLATELMTKAALRLGASREHP